MNREAPKGLLGCSRLPAPVETIRGVVAEVFLFTIMFSRNNKNMNSDKNTNSTTSISL